MSPDQIEDEIHFMLDCKAYEGLREKMYDEISRRTQQKVDVRNRRADREKLLDTLIGRGIEGFRVEILKATMSYIVRASKVRKRYSGEQEIE